MTHTVINHVLNVSQDTHTIKILNLVKNVLMVVWNVMDQFALLVFKTMINTLFLLIMEKLVQNVIVVVLDVTFIMS